jgi:alpha-galactosidase
VPNRFTPRRRTVLHLLGGSIASAAFASVSVAKMISAKPAARIGDDFITIEFDGAMHSRVLHKNTELTAFEASETITLKGGKKVERFLLVEHKNNVGQHMLRGLSVEGIEKTVDIHFDKNYPGFAFFKASYKNIGKQPMAIASNVNAAHILLPAKGGFWSFSGATHEDRRDWVQPLKPGFDQRNFMGMNASDYGGGTPVADVWRRDVGLAVGHIETVPKLVALPVTQMSVGARIAIESDQPVILAPGESFTTHAYFVAVHTGDHFSTLDSYRRIMVEKGIAAPHCGPACYEPIWCAWGYERNFTVEQIVATLPKAKSLGLKWAVLDDGWQTNEGDWKIDTKKFARGEPDMVAFAKSVKAAGMRPRLWLAPLAVDPGTDLLHDHADMLLLNADGAVQDVTWWNSFTLCPAYPPTIEYFKKLVAKIIGEWNYEGIKLDGQHLNGVAPCYNPAHHHARPEESYEKLQDFWKALYDTAIAINPDAVIEICPCGTSFAFHNIQAMNQTPASDPLSSWQVRLKGKSFKALMGPSAPYAGDHVELSDRGSDFASTVGIGGIVSTKFTWPKDTDNPSGDVLPPGGYVLTPEKEVLWKKWITLYNEKMLPTGTYLGGLYDIGFDKPEGHVIAKDKKLYYAFYAPRWTGPIALRGLGDGAYTLNNMFTGASMGQVSATANSITTSFEHYLLIEATLTGANHA